MALCLFSALAFKTHHRELNQSPLRQQLGKGFLIQRDFTVRSFTIRAEKIKVVIIINNIKARVRVS